MKPSDSDIPVLSAEIRAALVAPVDAIVGVLRRPPEPSEENGIESVHEIEANKWVVRFRGYEEPGECFSMMPSGYGLSPRIEFTFSGPRGIEMFTWTVDAGHTASIVRGYVQFFVTDKQLWEDLAQEKAKLATQLERTISHIVDSLGLDEEEESDGAAEDRYRLTFHPPSETSLEPIASFSHYGGQPLWIDEPQWPVARETGKPMTFVLQIELPEPFRFGGHRVAYLFIDTTEREWRGYDPDAGFNAVILQGGEVFHPHVPTVGTSTGETLKPRSPKPWERQTMDPTRDIGGVIEIEPAELGDEFPEFPTIGQDVEWLQNDDTPQGGPWRLVLQFDDEQVPGMLPFSGWGYVFIADDGQRARFLYQIT